MFFDEEMLLDVRLNVLNKYIDKFIITESTYTQIKNLTLKPGINTVVLENDKFVLVGKTKVSLKVESISITN